MSRKPRVLYMSYDGMTDPLGQSQVIPYLKLIGEHGISFDILSYEKPDAYAKNKDFIKELISGHDINWYPLEYHKKPPIISTLKDLRDGRRFLTGHFAKNEVDMVHCRGYITAILGKEAKKKYGKKFIFDMRGWWADEKKESGLWNSPVYLPVYRYFKKLEREFFETADRSVSLTYAGQEEISRLQYQTKDKVTVIPTCVDLDVFQAYDPVIRSSTRAELDIPDKSFVMIYSGALGGYYRTDVILDIFKSLLKFKSNSYLILLTRVDHDFVKSEIKKSGAPADRILVRSSEFRDVHRYLQASDLGLIIYSPLYSSIGRSPTKLGEYWASGLPVIAIKGAGDLDRIFNRYPDGGTQLESFTNAEYEQRLQIMFNRRTNRERLRDFAVDYFDVRKGAETYYELYQELLGK